MLAEDVIAIYRTLSAHHIRVWLIGGWGIDALLGEQTRPHKDLDLIMLVDDVARLRELLAGQEYSLKELWSENRWEVDNQGREIPTAFVLRDPTGRELDLHALRLDRHGNGIPAWTYDQTFIFSQAGLAGRGMIDQIVVPCLTPAMQMTCHTGYDLPAAHQRDLQRLHERFGVAYPD